MSALLFLCVPNDVLAEGIIGTVKSTKGEVSVELAGEILQAGLGMFLQPPRLEDEFRKTAGEFSAANKPPGLTTTGAA